MSLFEETHTFTVAEVGRMISEVLNVTFPADLWVQGEVRGIRRPGSGHVYFDLVDASGDPGRPPDAKISVVLFKATKELVNGQIRQAGGGMRIDDGVEIRVRARPDFYPPQGRLQLRMTGIDPTYTLGQLEAARDRLLRQLHAEALLEANGRLPFPVAPLRIGLVTAAGSAAHADFCEELRRSGYAFDVVFVASPVQGLGAAARVAGAIRACGGHAVDVIAVVRGGGARTDLVAFDDAAVARAIAAAPVPVITGVGHEIDTSVADMVAHAALKTPTACAGMLIDRVAAAERRTEDAWGGIAALARASSARQRRRVDTAAQGIETLAQHSLRDARHRTATAARLTRDLTRRVLDRGEHVLARHLQAATLHARHRLRSADRTLDDAEVRVRLLDPATALARGWTITTDDSGAIVRSAAAVAAGARLTTRVSDGVIVSTVDSTIGNGSGAAPGSHHSTTTDEGNAP